MKLHHDDPFRPATNAVVARIRRDRKFAPKALKKVFAIVANKLFHPALRPMKIWAEAGVKNHAMRSVFPIYTGITLREYIAKARIDIAQVVILNHSDLTLASIAQRLGYSHYSTFAANFKRLKGELPSEVERGGPPPLIDDEITLKAIWGLLDTDQVVAYVEDLLRLYPHLKEHFHIHRPSKSFESEHDRFEDPN